MVRPTPGGVTAMASKNDPLESPFVPMNRRLPHNIDAEMAFLGGVLIDDGVLDETPWLRDDHFAYSPHVGIFREIIRCRALGLTPNAVVLKGWFASSVDGGEEYLMTLCQCAGSRVNSVEYGRLITDLWARRQIIDAAFGLFERAHMVDWCEDYLDEAIYTLRSVRPAYASEVSAFDNSPPSIPERVWISRPIFGQIRDYARYLQGSPDSLLWQCIIRSATVMPTSCVISTIGDSVKPLNFMMITVAPSGVGKGETAAAARRIIPDPEVDWIRMDVPIGSGEGIAELYMGEDSDKKRVQIVNSAHFDIPEGEKLLRLMKRDSAVLGETLRQAFSGEVIGEQNASADRTRRVKKYRFCMTVSSTMSTVGNLLKFGELGLPSRFIWTTGNDNTAPDVPEFAPLPSIRFRQAATVLFDARIKQEIQRGRTRALRNNGYDHELDSQTPIIRCRVAAVLALWDDRDEVTLEDWSIAGELLATSARFRDWAIDAAERRQIADEGKEAEAKGRVAQVTRVMTDMARDAHTRAAYWVIRAVTAQPGVSLAELDRRCPKHSRVFLRQAIDEMVQTGQIKEVGKGRYEVR